MYAVGRLGSYITQGVYTVSGPFHPFGGAVDIIVVEQQDGTFKSSPWYVRFGKFQGVLKSKEKIVNISVDGVESDFHMYLDSRGQAYFLREVECEEGDSLFYPLSSGEDTDVAVSNRRPLKSKSCNYDSPSPDSIDVGEGKMVIRKGSRRSRILGFVLGRRSMKENSFREDGDKDDVARTDSLTRAEIAANLLEVEWSTNLAFSRYKKDKGPKKINSDFSVNEDDKDSQNITNYEKGEEIEIECDDIDARSKLRFQKLENSDEDFAVEMSSLDNGLKEDNCVLDSSNVDDDKGLNPILDSLDLIAFPKDANGISEVKSIHETSLLVGKEPIDFSVKLVNSNFENFVNDGTQNEISSNPLANCINPKIVSEKPFVPVEEITEEEILLFGEFDDSNDNNNLSPKSVSSTHIVEDDIQSLKVEICEEGVREKHWVASSSIDIRKGNEFENIGRMAESLPNMWLPMSDVDLESLQNPLSHSLDSNSEISKKNVSTGDLSSSIKSDTEKAGEEKQYSVEEEELNNVPIDDRSKEADLSNGRWRVWPFSFKKSKSMNNTDQVRTTKSLDSEINLKSTISEEEEKDESKPKAKKTKKVKVLTPTPEQLASLKLKEGVNTVTFTFSTSMLGPQQVEARIFLWKWDTRIVISDVDGTITKSDVLGQFMPMMGMDWSHTGVAHLYSAIQENGYQLLFLSARAISQAYLTRQFLFNLKQDGKALPNGPVVISPDGLFPSLFREVIRRAPHEFKIACLEDIKALFPSDRSPFYAGFGNRNTDEISYLKVGIPKGKIFTINPKGEVVVSQRVDRKSYTSLKALVHNMFPPMSSEEEDYNSWNFWKLPPPIIDM